VPACSQSSRSVNSALLDLETEELILHKTAEITSSAVSRS